MVPNASAAPDLLLDNERGEVVGEEIDGADLHVPGHRDLAALPVERH